MSAYKQHLGVDVSGRAADGLHQRRFAPQEAFLVGVEDRHQRDLGQVEPFAEQVHAHQHVEMPLPQVAEQFDPLEGVQLAVQPLAADVLLAEIGRQVLGQPLGERGHQHPFARLGPLADLFQQVRHLVPRRGDFDLRVQQARRPDHLLDRLAARLGQFVGPRRGRDEDHLVEPALPFLEPQRPVVQGAGQAEAVLDQRHLAVVVAEIHAADLRHGDVRLVDQAAGNRRERS